VTVFGDITEEDRWDAAGRLEPFALAVGFHEDVVLWAGFEGRTTRHWWELDDGERLIGVHIAERLAERLVTPAGLTPARDLARFVHQLRHSLEPDTTPAWNDLDRDDMATAVEIMAGVIERLEAEGTLR
jgi:hypothetical protein